MKLLILFLATCFSVSASENFLPHFSPVTATGTFIGNGAGLSNVVASAVSSSISNQWRVDATNAATAATTNLNASNLASGTVPVAQLPALWVAYPLALTNFDSRVLVFTNNHAVSNQTFAAGVSIGTNGNISASGSISGALNASQLTSGTVPTAQLPTLLAAYPLAVTNNDTRSLAFVGPLNSTNSYKMGTNTVAMCVAQVDVTNAASGSIGTTTIFTAPSSGMFDADIQLSTTVAGSAGTVTETLSWTDDIGATSATSGTCALSSQARNNPNVVGRFITAGSTITYATTVSGATGSPTYAVHIRIVFKP